MALEITPEKLAIAKKKFDRDICTERDESKCKPGTHLHSWEMTTAELIEYLGLWH